MLFNSISKIMNDSKNAINPKQKPPMKNNFLTLLFLWIRGRKLWVATFNGFVYGLFAGGVYKYDKNNWQLTPIFSPNVKRLKVSNGYLLSIADFRLITYNNQENIINNIQDTSQFSQLNDGLVAINGDIYLADGIKGLIKVTANNQFINIKPNGPNTNAVQSLNFINNQLVLSPGTISQVLAPSFTIGRFRTK